MKDEILLEFETPVVVTADDMSRILRYLDNMYKIVYWEKTGEEYPAHNIWSKKIHISEYRLYVNTINKQSPLILKLLGKVSILKAVKRVIEIVGEYKKMKHEDKIRELDLIKKELEVAKSRADVAKAQNELVLQGADLKKKVLEIEKEKVSLEKKKTELKIVQEEAYVLLQREAEKLHDLECFNKKKSDKSK